MTTFVSLHNQTNFSILDSLSSTKDLFNRAKELDQPAIAITDHGTFGAAWEALKISKTTGVKLIIGCEFFFSEKEEDKLRHVVLLAKNAEGYKNILTINRKGFDNNKNLSKKAISIINWDMLEQHSEGVICLTACGNGIVSQLLMKKEFARAEETLLRLHKIYGDNLGIEVQPNNMKRNGFLQYEEIDQQFLNRQLINLGKKHNIKVVAACNSQYVNKEDHETHDVLLAIGSHQPVHSGFRLKYNVPEFYLKSGEEVKNFFKRNYGEEAADEFCANSLYFADMCEEPAWIDPKFTNPSGKELAMFPVSSAKDYTDYVKWLETTSDFNKGLPEDQSYLRFRCESALKKHLENISPDMHQTYIDRVNDELETLEKQNFCSYMLIVADYLQWCVDNDISIGPGRGSVGGCFVGFLLGIHQADSIKYGLIFERFQNKDKTSFPDCDCDVATSGRYALIDYVEKKYGTEHVCAISNYNTITPKVYAKDLARALELGGSKPEAVLVGTMLADMIPSEVKASSIDGILERLPLLAETVKTKYPQVKKYGNIIGAPRAQSTHAAGIIIAQRPLMGLAPLRRDKDGSVVIEYDKDVSEANGFVKMDILGLSTLDIITQTIELIKASGKPFNNEHLNYDANDKKTYDLISRGETYGVFQFGTSGGTIELCKKIKPKNIEDLAIITTLARPAAADIRSDFIATREGLMPSNVWHPLLKGAFEKTYGFGLFDESILQLGRDVAGWTMNEADRLRKMIKEKGKNPEKDKKLKDEFIQSTINNNGIDPVTAKKLWDEEVGKFQSYTFNKSHAIVYSMISYSTAYLKAHFPMEFLIANLRAEVNSGAQTASANIEKIKAEIRAQKINILPPDLNKSALEYSIVDDDTILTGLDAIKFVTEDAINDIIAKRPFKDFQDFMTRIDSKKVRSNTIQALAASGCLNQFGIERRSIFLYCSDYRKKLQSWAKKHTPDETFVYPFPTGEDWLLSEKYALEKKYLGESFICKPAKAYGSFFDGQNITIKKCKELKNKTKIGPLKVLVTDAFIFKVKKENSKLFGKNMARLIVEDKNGDSAPLTIFPDYWELMVAKLKKTKMEFGVGTVFSMAGSVNIYEDEFGIVLDEIYSIAPPPQVPEDLKHKKVSLRASKQKSLPTLLEDIEDELYEEGLIDLEEEDND